MSPAVYLRPVEVELPPWFFVGLAFSFGAAIGSFLNVVIARLPEGLSVVRPSSRCPHCGYSIPWYLNVPVLSWLVLRGRCASCKAHISIRYPVVELLTAVLFAANAYRFGPTIAGLLCTVLVTALVAISFIDIDAFEIPDEIVYPAMLVGAVLRSAAFSVPWWDGIAAAALGAVVVWMIRGVGFAILKKEVMGLGDAPLLATIGAYLGPEAIFPVLMLASMSGAVLGGLGLLAQRMRAAPIADEAPAIDGAEDEDGEEWVPGPTTIPFGPYLSLGAIAYMLFGPALLRLFFPWMTV